METSISRIFPNSQNIACALLAFDLLDIETFLHGKGTILMSFFKLQ